MTLLLLLGGASSAVTPPTTYYLTRERVNLYLTTPNRATRYQVGQWSSLSVEKDTHDSGPCVVTAPMNAAWITAADAAGAFDTVTGWEEYSFDLYVDGRLEWSGPIVRCSRKPGAAMHAYPTVEFTAETWTQNLLRRRSNASTTKASVSYTDNADDIVRQAIRNANGSVTPSGYPVATSRSNFGSFTVAVEADTSSASSITLSEQEGNNLWAFCTGVAEKGGLYIDCTESPAGTFTFGVAYPYVRNDRTASIILTPAAGSVLSYQATRSLEDIVNLAAMKGSGSGSSQVKTWYKDVTSYGTRGGYEGEATLPEAASSAYTDAEGAAYLDRLAAPLDTVEAEVRSTAGAWFTFHPSSATGQYGMRDTITIVLPEVSTAATATVVGWRLEQAGETPFRTIAKLGDWHASIGKQLAMRSGWAGPYAQGDRWRSTASP